jgi:hypothetical protein
VFFGTVFDFLLLFVILNSTRLEHLLLRTFLDTGLYALLFSYLYQWLGVCFCNGRYSTGPRFEC